MKRMFQNNRKTFIPVLMVLLATLWGCGSREPGSVQTFGTSSSFQTMSASDQIALLQSQLYDARDSLMVTSEIISRMNVRLSQPSDSVLTRYALALWKRGQSDDAITLLTMVDGRDSSRGFGGRRGTVLITVFMLTVVVLGFIFVALRMFRRLSMDRSEQSFNRVLAALAGLLIYFVFSVAGLSLPVLLLNSLATVKPIYSVILNFLSMLLGATATLFVGTMLQSQGERTVQLGIILGVFTCVFFVDMLFKALFFAFDLTVLLPNSMFVLGVVLVYLFARDPKGARRQEYAEGY